ncbi:AAA family ATPase [Corynebacterium sp. A21]|uniref:AAA family ATPase n=1 Tax=Corynebacterium sp. A21 TaxID=3457318 RepID=UPI003FD1183E
MIISIVNAKGGVGKTTTSMYLAAAFVAQGKSVKVIDLDRQGTAIDWFERAEDSGDPLPFAVENTIPRRLERIARLAGNDEVLIVDTPPGDPEAIQVAIKEADFVVVPTRATNADLARVWEIQPELEKKQYAALITFARSGTSSLEVVLEALKDNGVPVFEKTIPLRENIHSTFGYIPGPDTHGYDSVAQQIVEIVK